MREILFRGKRIDNGEWVEGYLAAYDMICPDYSYPEDTTNATGLYYGKTPYVGFVDVDPATVVQYTGLTDKNGKRIFEGDIVEDASVGLLGDVVFSVVGVPSFGINDVHDGLQYHDGFWSDLEVIGNIHDNPELLEGGADNG